MKVGVHVALAAALVGAAGLTACSGGAADSGGASQGWTKVTIGQLTLERPAAWSEADPSGETWDKRFVGEGVEMQVSGEFSEDPTASAALSRLDLPAMTGLEGYDGGGAKKVEVEGADTAIRSDFTYTDGGPRKGVWLIVGQYPHPRTSAVSITGEKLDEATVAHIVDSMTWEKKSS
ncbi:hypothetical protein ACOCJ5_07970 [Knoellia sp. CPCC 206450]|uniref:hypothetical protein n=1 Tax=Knoellia tibetensis TaxID=3404798 RepID=UPI003B42BEF4